MLKVSTLDNGLRIVTQNMPGLETAYMGIFNSVGNRDEKKEINGAAHFLEHMAFKGTKTKTALEISDTIENVGGNINAYTSKEITAYTASLLGDDLHYGIGGCGPGDKLRGMRVEALSANSGIITCLANDTGYENIFSQQLEVKSNIGDLLIALSGSGNSANIIKAIKVAKDKGLKTYAILAYDGGICKQLADVPIHFPIDDMQIAEDTQSPVEATALADAIRRRSEGINLLKPLFANESLVSDSRVPLLVWWAVENRITQAEEAEYLKLANLFSSGDLWKHSLFETTTFRVIRRLAFGSNTTELEVLTKVLKAVPKSHADHARDALRLGISERVNDFATVQQGTLFTDFAEVKGVKEAQIDKPSRSVAVSELLNRLVCEKIEESPDDKAWVEIGLMLGLPIAKELLQASMVNGSPFSEETAVGILLPHLKGGQAVKLASDSIMRSVKANGGLASHQVTFIEVLANENAMNAPDIFLVLYKELQADRQQAIRTAMLSRRDWAIR